MAEDRDATLKLRADISDLKAGITEANRQIRLANSEFKAASNGSKEWAASADGLTAKQKQLGSVLDAQRAKLGTYEQQLEETS